MILRCGIQSRARISGHPVYTYHSPPEGVRVAGEMTETGAVAIGVDDVVLLRQVDEIGREDETEKSNVQRRY